MSFLGNQYPEHYINKYNLNTPHHSPKLELEEYFYPFPIQNIVISYTCFWLGSYYITHQRFCISLCTKSTSVLHTCEVFRGHLVLLN